MNTSASGSGIYYHDIDILRGLLMSLGIVLHAAMYLDAGFAERWININLSSVAYNYWGMAIRLFRMETFFMIAGFFAAMLAQRYSARKILYDRAVRLLVPMLFCGLTLNLALGFLNESGLAERWPLSGAYWLGGQWLSHLWFLPVLFIYTAVFLLINYLCQSVRFLAWPNPRNVRPWAVLALVYLSYPVLVFFCSRVGWKAEDTPFWGRAFLGLLWAPEVFEYMPDFFLGIVMWKLGLLRAFTQKSLLGLHIGLSLLFLYGILYMPFLDSRVQELMRHAVAIPLSFALIGVFSVLFKKPKKWGRLVARSSYTVYLLHMPVLICIAYVLKGARIESPHTAFAILFIVTLAVCLTAHHFIQKSRIAKLLLNGKRAESSQKKPGAYPEAYRPA